MADDDLQGAAAKYLLATPSVVSAVGSFDISGKPFIFRDEILANLESKEYQPIGAIVVSDGGPIAMPVISRFRLRRLEVAIWANGTRDLGGALVNAPSVPKKIDAIFKAVDRVLHRTSAEPVMWGDLLTISSERLTDLSKPVLVSEGDGLMTASAIYSVGF